MTAQIVLMNKSGVAVGSDSSLTMTRGDNRRTYASAEKIYPLGETHKVAVLHSGATEFMSHPYDILLTSWKKSLTKPFQHLEDYTTSFINWLNHRQDLFSEEMQLRWAHDIHLEYFLEVRRLMLDWLKENEIEESQWSEDYVLEGINKILADDIEWITGLRDLDGLSEKWAETRMPSLWSSISEAIEYVFDDVPRDSKSDELYRLISKKILHKSISNEMDGVLAFVGFGDDDLYPVHIWVTFQGVIGDKARVLQTDLRIASDSEYSLRTHGQSEAIFTFLGGRHFSFGDVVQRKLKDSLESSRNFMIEKYGDLSAEDDEILSKIESEASTAMEEALDNHEQKKFREPFTSTLSGLPMTSMGKMAESLIQLQILRQSSQAIQDTVGGPVDVGVISLEYGFQWFRHKTVEDAWKGI